MYYLRSSPSHLCICVHRLWHHIEPICWQRGSPLRYVHLFKFVVFTFSLAIAFFMVVFLVSCFHDNFTWFCSGSHAKHDNISKYFLNGRLRSNEYKTLLVIWTLSLITEGLLQDASFVTFYLQLSNCRNQFFLFFFFNYFSFFFHSSKHDQIHTSQI